MNKIEVVNQKHYIKAQSQTAVDIVSTSPVVKKNAGIKNEGSESKNTFDTVDTVDVSEEAKKKAKDFQDKLEEMRNDMRMLRDELKRAGEAAEGAAEMWRIEIKCMLIAMRIMSGNKVPIEDQRFLMDNKPELYAKAITMRMEKADPKEHDRLSEDEEEGITGDPESAALEPASGEETGSGAGEEAVPADGN